MIDSKRLASRAALWLSLALLCTMSLGRGLMAADSYTPRDQQEAQKWLLETLKHAGVSNVKLENNLVTGQVGTQPFTIPLWAVTSAQLQAPPAAPAFGVTAGVEWFVFPNLKDDPGRAFWHNAWMPNDAIRDQRRFQAALIFLARKAQEEMEAKAAAHLEEFKPKAAEWRQLVVKPEMPEEAHRHQVLAENAYQGKDIAKTIAEYEAALRADPLWPEGHYNLATLAGEIGGRPGYDIAIFHMKSYLELVPDAADARAAKDSIIVWEDRRGN
jgi:tetratricopeptide (TPR) repeat protein